MLKKQNIDWDRLGFNASKTRSMWVGDCLNDEAWSRGALEPYGNINISPAACVLNYAQGVFEGMKAYHTKKNRIVLFRPEMNANRMAESTEKMCIPIMVQDYFINAVKATTLDNIDFVPSTSSNRMMSPGRMGKIDQNSTSTHPILGMNSLYVKLSQVKEVEGEYDITYCFHVQSQIIDGSS